MLSGGDHAIHPAVEQTLGMVCCPNGTTQKQKVTEQMVHIAPLKINK